MSAIFTCGKEQLNFVQPSFITLHTRDARTKLAAKDSTIDFLTPRMNWFLPYAEGHNVLVVSTDPAHSLSDSFDQDVSGGEPVQIEGTTLPIWGMEIDADEARRTFQSASTDESKNVSRASFVHLPYL